MVESVAISRVYKNKGNSLSSEIKRTNVLPVLYCSNQLNVHHDGCSYLWLMWVRAVGSFAETYLLVGKVVSVSSVSCCIVVPLHGYKKKKGGKETRLMTTRRWRVQVLMGSVRCQRLTLVYFSSWRGTLESRRPAVELCRLEPAAALVLDFLLFLWLCLRRSCSFFLCFLFVKKQMSETPSI